MAAPGAGLDPGYERLRDAALHARAEAFPLGLSLLIRNGITSWRQALTDLAGDCPTVAPPATSTRPTPTGPVTAELIDALAGLALAGLALAST